MATTVTSANYSIPSILALVAAVLSFVAGPFWGIILALAAVAFGIIGVLLSLAPSVRGGFVSIVSMAAGILGIIVAGFKTLAWIL
jgi:hypothetical protein